MNSQSSSLPPLLLRCTLDQPSANPFLRVIDFVRPSRQRRTSYVTTGGHTVTELDSGRVPYVMSYAVTHPEVTGYLAVRWLPAKHRLHINVLGSFSQDVQDAMAACYPDEFRPRPPTFMFPIPLVRQLRAIVAELQPTEITCLTWLPLAGPSCILPGWVFTQEPLCWFDQRLANWLYHDKLMKRLGVTRFDYYSGKLAPIS